MPGTSLIGKEVARVHDVYFSFPLTQFPVSGGGIITYLG